MKYLALGIWPSKLPSGLWVWGRGLSLSSCHILALRGLRFLLLLSPQLCPGKIWLKLRGTDLDKPEHATHSWMKKMFRRSCTGMWYIKQVPIVYNAKDTRAGRGSELASFIHNKKIFIHKNELYLWQISFRAHGFSMGLNAQTQQEIEKPENGRDGRAGRDCLKHTSRIRSVYKDGSAIRAQVARKCCAYLGSLISCSVLETTELKFITIK